MDQENLEQRLYELEQKWFNKTITLQEAQEYAAWYNAHQEDPIIISPSFASGDAELEQRILQKIRERTGLEAPVVPLPARRLPIRRIAAAAVIVLLVGAGTYVWVSRSPRQPATQMAQQPPVLVHDIAPPTGSKTTLTLGNGRQIILDSAANGSLAQQGGARVEKVKSGQLAYSALPQKPTEILYNTLSTARGGQTMVVLEDGTKVWLNALSSLRYPTAFTGAERKVELTGEAYFEVAKNAAMPFKVMTHKGTEVEVLGTQFDVMAYEDESMVKTTLLEGAVSVSQGNRTATLQPGQQAQINGAGDIHLVKEADTEAAVAWKNGLFQFSHADIETVMRQIARWYDVDVVYQGEKPSGHFGGKIARNVNASEILQVIAVSGVHFQIEGRRILVTP